MSQSIDESQAGAAQAAASQGGAGEAGGSILAGDGAGAADNKDTLLGGAEQNDQEGTNGTEGVGDGQEKPDATQQPAEPVQGLVPLPDDASDEQRAEFDKKLRALAGVPQDPAGYGDFGFGDEAKIDTSSEDYKFYIKLFHDAGISTAQAKKLLVGHQKFASDQVEHFKRTETDTINQYRASVKAEFVKSCGGDAAFKEFNEVAVRGFKASAQGAGLTDKDVKGLLNVMGDDPRFIKIFHAIGKMHREDVLITGAAPRAQEKTFDDMFSGMFNKGA
ncbi:hypothetical protein [Desulfovibrio desulfuricans]|jgi:hypothetical protein|uniref:hypothetical protein n=1 Tax=Desulfovibrio desulfuricans TaxID=876 RepID=UPI001C020D54|nr:hypothetical protein [Desulfovibrio desulfuricans]MBT9748612.1 hypothetical protein [Desulfovibrio desulfuricans]